MKMHTKELLLSAAKSMATAILSRKKLTLICLSDNIVGCQIQWLNTFKNRSRIKLKADSVLPCGERSPQLLLLPPIYSSMRKMSLERVLCFVVIPFNNLRAEDTKENNMGGG